MPKIISFEDACAAQGLDPVKALPDVSMLPEVHQKAIVAAAKLFIIADALNEGWVPDWNNYDQYKYYPWFDMKKTENNSSGFSLHLVYYRYTVSIVGSRLCFRSREIANWAGAQFLDLYRDLMVR